MDIYTDGSSRHYIAYKLGANPVKICKAIAPTANQSEYWAVIYALRAVPEAYPDVDLSRLNIDLYSDSELMVRQLLGQYQIKSRPLSRLYDEVDEAACKFSEVNFLWIPRERNLAGIALEEFLKGMK